MNEGQGQAGQPGKDATGSTGGAGGIGGRGGAGQLTGGTGGVGGTGGSGSQEPLAIAVARPWRLAVVAVAVMSSLALVSSVYFFKRVDAQQQDIDRAAAAARYVRIYACTRTNVSNGILRRLLVVTRPGLERRPVRMAWDRAIPQLAEIDCLDLERDP